MADMTDPNKGQPAEIWDKIFSDLSPVDVASVSRVCKAWEVNSRKLRNDAKRVDFMLKQAQSFRADIGEKLKIARYRHSRVRGRGRIGPSARSKPAVEARLKGLMQQNLRITELYNTAKKDTDKKSWNPKIGKEIMAAGRDLIALLKVHREMGFNV